MKIISQFSFVSLTFFVPFVFFGDQFWPAPLLLHDISERPLHPRPGADHRAPRVALGTEVVERVCEHLVYGLQQRGLLGPGLAV